MGNRKQAVLGTIWIVLLLVLTTSCQPAELAAADPVTITLTGSTAMQPLLIELTTEFTRQHPHVIFDIAGGGSTVGEERVRRGQVTLAASTLVSPTLSASSLISPSLRTRALISPTLSLAAGLGSGANEPRRIPIGLDGVVIIVHATNPIDSLTSTQLQELFRGRIWNWQALGGQDETVLLAVREDGSGTRAIFDERIMGEIPLALTAVVMPTSQAVVEYVAKNPAAIGYVSRAFVVDQLPATAGENAPTLLLDPLPAASSVRPVAIEGQLPTTAALREQSYFLIQPLYLVSHGQPRGWTKQFIDFTLSPAGQAIVARYHLPIR